MNRRVFLLYTGLGFCGAVDYAEARGLATKRLVRKGSGQYERDVRSTWERLTPEERLESVARQKKKEQIGKIRRSFFGGLFFGMAALTVSILFINKQGHRK